MTSKHDDYFQTDDLENRVGRETVRGGALTISGTLLAMVVRLGSLFMLARLLSPREFGLFGMAMVPSAVISIFRQLGYPTAIVQSSVLHHSQVTQLFWINVKWVGLLTFAAILSIPAICFYFGEQRLVPLALAAIFGTAVVATSSIHAGLLRRRMRFGVLFTEKICSIVCGAIVGVGLALQGVGAWALVLQHVTINLGIVLIRWQRCSWRPSRPRRGDSDQVDVRSLLRFGNDTLAVRILDQLSIQLHTVIVGGISSVAMLGIYQNALRWAQFPAELVTPLGRVAISGLSRLRGSAEGYQACARMTMLVLFSVLLPTTALIMLDTEALILLLLGSPWLQATPILRLLAVAMCADCIMRITELYILTEGHTGWLVRWSLFRNAMSTVGLLLGAVWGPTGAAAGFAITSWICVVPTVFGLLTLTPVSWRGFLAAICRPAIACGASCGLVAFGLRWCGSVGAVLPFATMVLLFSVAYTVLWVVPAGGMNALRAMVDLASDKPSSNVLLNTSALHRESLD